MQKLFSFKQITITHFVLLSSVVITGIFSIKGILQSVHWDAPIYLLRAKYFELYVESYIRHADEISQRALSGMGPGSNYWGFTRIGNTVLLGITSRIFSITDDPLFYSSLVYTSLLTLGLGFTVLLSIKLGETYDNTLPRRNLINGALLSGLLIICSDVFFYLCGNFVSEPPALFLAAGSTLALVMACESRRISFAILSGVLAFLLYTVKMDAIWVYCTFIILYGVLLLTQARNKFWWPAFLVSSVNAIFLYCCYFWFFYPLSDPRVALGFRSGFQALDISRTTDTLGIVQWIAAGGLLWIGFLFALFYNIKRPVMWMVLAWLVLMSLPYYNSMFSYVWMQVRALALMIIPLMLASTLGWASYLSSTTGSSGSTRKITNAALASVVLFLIAVSHTPAYEWMREQLPGGWRLQFIRQFLSPVDNEKKYFPLRDIKKMSDFLYSDDNKKIVIWNPDKTAEFDEYISLLYYYGLNSNVISDFLTNFSPTVGHCQDHMSYEASNPVIYCTEVSESEQSDKIDLAYPSMLLIPVSDLQHEKSDDTTIVFQSGKIALRRMD